MCALPCLHGIDHREIVGEMRDRSPEMGSGISMTPIALDYTALDETKYTYTLIMRSVTARLAF